jgi:mono/diheme cytochrome c family protein
MNRRLLACLAGSWLFAALPGLPARGAAVSSSPSDCDSIDAVPMRFDIAYALDVQPIFDQHCANCHVDSGGAPEAGMELDSGVSWFQLVGVASSQDPGLTRVIPFDAANSLLFQKVNCYIPAIGDRMPFERDELSTQEQAIIHDWIATGASAGASEAVFYSGFEDR